MKGLFLIVGNQVVRLAETPFEYRTHNKSLPDPLISAQSVIANRSERTKLQAVCRPDIYYQAGKHLHYEHLVNGQWYKVTVELNTNQPLGRSEKSGQYLLSEDQLLTIVVDNMATAMAPHNVLKLGPTLSQLIAEADEQRKAMREIVR